MRYCLKKTTDDLYSGNAYVGGLCGEITCAPGACEVHATVEVKNKCRLAGIIFGYCQSDGGTISNLKAYGSISSNGDYVGGVIGHLKNPKHAYASALASTTTISNCTNEGTITSTGNYVGGIVGICTTDGEYSRITVTGCSSTVDVSGKMYVGGLVGKGERTLVNSMTNSKNVTGTVYVGGIVGYVWQVTNCVNSGNITATDFDDNKNVHVGGIAGAVESWIDECSNSGDVKSTRNGTYVGGIVGLCHSDGTTINNLSNTGSVSSNGECVGGVIGHLRNPKSAYASALASNTTVSNCTNEGTITSTGNYVGGIVGLCNTGGQYSSITITRCSSIVNLNGTNEVGGILGRGENTTVKLSENRGDIKGKTCVGGIAGSSSGASNCDNYGIISGQKQFDQIIGSGGTIVDCNTYGSLIQLELDPDLQEDDDDDSSGNGMCSGIIAVIVPVSIGLIGLPFITRRF